MPYAIAIRDKSTSLSHLFKIIKVFDSGETLIEVQQELEKMKREQTESPPLSSLELIIVYAD